MRHKSTPQVGIILPAYNQGYYVDDAIKSLRSQTFQDFTVHIVDDGSADGFTPKKLASINYDKATLFPNKDNLGIVKRQHEHYKLLETDYILILCADDKIAPTFLEKSVNFLESHKDHGAVATNIKNFSDDNSLPFSSIHFDSSLMTLPNILVKNHFLGSSLMRKKALDSIDLSGTLRYQDWDRWIGMLKNGWKLGHIPEELFYYRRHSTSLSLSATIDDELTIRKVLYNKHRDLYEKYSEEIFLLTQSSLLLAERDNSRLVSETLHLQSEKEVITQSFTTSLSWRITKPLRLINSTLKRLRHSHKLRMLFYIYPTRFIKWIIRYEHRRYKKTILPEITFPPTKKRRLVVTMTYLDMGGVERMILNLIKGLDPKIYDIHLITTAEHSNPWHSKFSSLVASITHIPQILDDSFPTKFRRKVFLSYITALNPDVILTTNSLLTYQSLPTIRKQFPNIPIYDILHTHGRPVERDAFLRISNPYRHLITKRITVSQYLKDYFVKKYPVSPDQVQVIYNSIDCVSPEIPPLDISLKNTLNRHKDKTIISFIGRLEVDKNPERLVSIAKQLLDKNLPAILIVAGDGSMMNQLQTQAKSDNTLGHTIEFIGSTDNPLGLAAASRFTILTSSLEGVPLSILESMSVGTPTIASAVGGIPEIIENNSGLPVQINLSNEPQTIDNFLTAIQSALDLTDKQYSQMSRSAKNQIKAKFSSMPADYDQLLRKSS